MILYIHCSIPFSIPPLHSIFHSTVTFHIPLQLLETPNTGHECGLSCNGAYFLHKERCRKITNFAWLIFHQLFNYQEVLSPSVLCKFVFTTFSPHTVNASAPFTPPKHLSSMSSPTLLILSTSLFCRMKTFLFAHSVHEVTLNITI